MRAMVFGLLLCAACAGDPFEMAEAGAVPLEAEGDARDAGVDASTLDGSRDWGDAPAAGDAVTEITPPISDGGAGNDAPPDVEPIEAAVDARADADPAESSTVDSAPAPLCCAGAGQVSCSSSVQCYAQGASCTAENVYGPDGGQYQTFACPGASSPCSAGCAAGSPCLWPGPEPGQWLGGSVEACR